MKSGGWRHGASDKVDNWIPPVNPSLKREQLNFEFIHKFLFSRTTDKQLKGLAEALGVEALSLKYLGAAWDSEAKAWAFPMRDEARKVIGIRYRAMNGAKWALAGSRAGLFIPNMPTEGLNQISLCEGPTDAAALLSMGLMAVARPSCLGCEELVNGFIRKEKIKEAMVVSDNDEPGIRGAEKLQASLKIKSCLFIPPCKDIREFLNLGGNLNAFRSISKDLIWTTPKP